MKVSVNGVDLFEISDIKKHVMKNNIHADLFDADIKRRLQWVLLHKYEQCFKDLKAEWDSKLVANGVEMIPTDPDAYAALVFAQPNYKCRKTRDLESKKSQGE